jgi:hypothetical protein
VYLSLEKYNSKVNQLLQKFKNEIIKIKTTSTSQANEAILKGRFTLQKHTDNWQCHLLRSSIS